TELPPPGRRRREFGRLDSERTERRRDRVGENAADRNDAALARALGAARIVGRGPFLECDRADVRKIVRGGHEVVSERAGEQLSVLVIDEMFEERAAKTLHDGAHDLAV